MAKREMNVRITIEDLSQLEDKRELTPTDKELENAFTEAILDMDLSNHYFCRV